MHLVEAYVMPHHIVTLQNVCHVVCIVVLCLAQLVPNPMSSLELL